MLSSRRIALKPTWASAHAYLSIFPHKSKVQLRRQAIFDEFLQLASAPDHPAFSSIPPLPPFENGIVNESELDPPSYAASFSNTLDVQWPNWALTRTNVLGVILSDALRNCPLYRNDLPRPSYDLVGVRFEKQLFLEAYARHDIDWWVSRRLAPTAWCRPKEAMNDLIMYPGHPFRTAGPKDLITWRAGFLRSPSRRQTEEEDYVFV
ncbi:hypothetical protein FRC08_016534 [Ceratobasidium sp. 394]|nr:hypothetical protein FRC08_016534 [Ceratobasidium sp. 394]